MLCLVGSFVSVAEYFWDFPIAYLSNVLCHVSIICILEKFFRIERMIISWAQTYSGVQLELYFYSETESKLLMLQPISKN